jgi:hypothetical protein
MTAPQVLDLDALKSAAIAAGNSHWYKEGFNQIVGTGTFYGGLIMHADSETIVAQQVLEPWASYIALANPRTVLALIAEVEQARQARRDAQAVVESNDAWSADMQSRLMEALKDSDDDGTTNLMGEAACALKMGSIEAATLRARFAAASAIIDVLADRVEEQDARLEIDPCHPYDGISTRDATISELERLNDDLADKVKGLEAQLREVSK